MKNLARLLLIVVGLCSGCSETPDPHAAATWDGGSVTVAEVEASLDGLAVQAATDVNDIVEAFRTASERLAATRIAFGTDGGDLLQEGTELDLDEASLRREVLTDLFTRQRLLPRITVTAGQLEEFYSENPDLFERRERRFVSHIYRRHREADQQEETITLLEELRTRAESGETFEQLATEYSDSETRLLGGRLGWIGRGRLPGPLEEIVFALEKDVVSEPVPSRDGAFLFLVTDALESMVFSFEDVKTMIARRLVRLELDRLTAELAENAPLPDESLFIEPGEVLSRLREAPDEEIVLRVGSDTVDAAAMRQLVEQGAKDEIQWAEFGDLSDEVYTRRTNLARMLISDEVVTYGEDPEVAAAVDGMVQTRLRRAADDARIEALLLDRVGEDSAAVEAFYRDNSFLYQTPLEVHLENLSVPLTVAGERVMGRLLDVRSRLEEGSVTLGEAAEEVGGRVDELGWLGADALAALEPKVRTYILDLDGEGYTVPFQLNRELHLIHVAKRREPRVLPLDEVLDRVQLDYFSRHQQEIFREWAAETLAENDYRFHEESVRRDLESRSAGLSG